MQLEVSIAVDADAFVKGILDLGEYTPFTCPECAGVLIRLREGFSTRFRCHTGHGYSSAALLSGVMEKIDAGYWEVMRGLEEASLLLDELGKGVDDDQHKNAAKEFSKEARRARKQSQRLRKMVLESQPSFPPRSSGSVQ